MQATARNSNPGIKAAKKLNSNFGAICQKQLGNRYCLKHLKNVTESPKSIAALGIEPQMTFKLNTVGIKKLFEDKPSIIKQYFIGPDSKRQLLSQ